MLLVAATLVCIGSALDLAGGTIDLGGAALDLAQGITAFGVLLICLASFLSLFLQSAFFGPMVMSITQMLGDMCIWLFILLSMIAAFFFAYMAKTSNAADARSWNELDLTRYLFGLGLRISPLLGASPLVQQDDQDVFDFMLLHLYYVVVSVMLYSMLVALFSTRMTKDDSTRIPAFHRIFAALVLNEHLRSSVPPPLQAVSILATWIIDVALAGSGHKTDREWRLSQSQRVSKPDLEPKSTPEKTWHTLDYTRKWSAAGSLLTHCSSYVEAELLKREGALSASTSKSSFGLLEDQLVQLKGKLETMEAKFESMTLTLNKASGGNWYSNVQSSLPQLSTRRTLWGKLTAVRSDVGLTQANVARAYGGFDETAERLIFHYGEYYQGDAEKHVVHHMTILANGVIENPKKQLFLGGVFNEAELQAMNEKQLEKELKDHDEGLAKQLSGNKAKLVASLVGKARDLRLKDRALAAFPMRQDILKENVKQHLDTEPNNVFVRKRANGTYGVTHCWPIKFNDKFKETFDIVSLTNPDESRFSPRAAAEYLDCMARLFNPPVKKGPSLLSAFCRGSGSRPSTSAKGKMYYASKSTFNNRTAIVGTAPQIIEYLRERPLLQEDLGIVKMFPNGFVTEIVINGEATGKTKQFHMANDGTEQVVYVKVGYETMTSVKPLDLFKYDCKFGKELEVDRDSRQPASRLARPGIADNDRTSEAVLKKHEKDMWGATNSYIA